MLQTLSHPTIKGLSLQFPSFDLFAEQAMSIDCYKIFFGYFGSIPSKKAISPIHGDKIKAFFFNEMKEQIVVTHLVEHVSWKKNKMMCDDVVFILDNELLISVSDLRCEVLFAQEKHEEAQAIINQLKEFRKRFRLKHSISLVVSSRSGIDTTELKIKKPKLNLDVHYNDTLKPLHNNILKHLRLKNKSGLFLFHGVPGTGKSTYIRSLIHMVDKQVIFIPPKIAANLDSPDFTAFLVNYPNTVFVIEDAEELIVTNNGQRNSGLSMVLNLSDGLLGEGLGIQIIATFNTDVLNIDAALLRKGRLNALYEFKPLCIDKSKKLLQQLGKPDYSVMKPMTLAELYNLDNEDIPLLRAKPTIGFLSARA